MSEIYCMWLTENTRHKNYAKNRHLCTIAQLCWAISSQLRPWDLSYDWLVHVAEKHVIGTNVSNEVRQRNQLLFSKLHSLLRAIIKLVPM